VINRGNYRADIFETEGAKQAFETCLFEACAKSGWALHGYVIMRNHYHLALETPEPNLVIGMQWLQATFACRFNRLRGERGVVVSEWLVALDFGTTATAAAVSSGGARRFAKN